MKETKHCPKCGGNNIYISEGGAGAHGSGNIINIGNFAWQAVPVDRYICCDCGYVEEFIRHEHLQRIAETKRPLK